MSENYNHRLTSVTPTSFNKHGIHAARVGGLHNSNKGRQPPVRDTSIFETSRLITNRLGRLIVR